MTGLNNCERDILTNMLCNDAGIADNYPSSDVHLSWRQVYYAFIDWRIYLYTAITIGDLAIVKCLTTYLPNLIESDGYSKTETEFMSGLPHLVAFVFAILVSFFSTRKNEHGYHLTFALTICMFGFVLLATVPTETKAILYVGTCMVSSGCRTAFPILMSWLTKNIGGHTKRAMAVGFAMGIGQIGGVVAPLVSQLSQNRSFFS